MNNVEGFFAVGAIIGPAIVTRLPAGGTPWKWLHVIAGTICVLLIITASFVKYPRSLLAEYRGRLMWVATYAISIFLFSAPPGDLSVPGCSPV